MVARQANTNPLTFIMPLFVRIEASVSYLRDNYIRKIEGANKFQGSYNIKAVLTNHKYQLIYQNGLFLNNLLTFAKFIFFTLHI